MPARITLTATSGPLAGRQFAFDARTVCTVGRARDCLLQLPSNPGDLTASRRHCVIAVDLGEVTVRDLGSTNGTYLNGAAVSREQPGRPLQGGDYLRVGDSTFRIALEDVAARGEAACSGSCGTALAT